MQQGGVPMLAAGANLAHQDDLHPVAVLDRGADVAYPDAPTVRGRGHDSASASWTVLHGAPAGTPEAALDRLDGA